MTHSTLTRAGEGGRNGPLISFTVAHCQCCRCTGLAAHKSLGPSLNGFRLESPPERLRKPRARAKHRPARSHAHYACATCRVFASLWSSGRSWHAKCLQRKRSRQSNEMERITRPKQQNDITSHIRCLRTSLLRLRLCLLLLFRSSDFPIITK